MVGLTELSILTKISVLNPFFQPVKTCRVGRLFADENKYQQLPFTPNDVNIFSNGQQFVKEDCNKLTPGKTPGQSRFMLRK